MWKSSNGTINHRFILFFEIEYALRKPTRFLPGMEVNLSREVTLELCIVDGYRWWTAEFFHKVRVPHVVELQLQPNVIDSDLLLGSLE